MILLKIDTAKAADFKRLLETTKGRYKSVSLRLQQWIDDHLGHADVDIVQFVHNELGSILTADPLELEAIISNFHVLGYQGRIYSVAAGELTYIGKELLMIFDYKSFRKSRKALWFAENSGIKSCTTCNTQYTLKTSQPKGEKLLFHLDHYFPKSVYPYLSLSYFNLLPCCASCNMSKSNKPFTISQNIHPYVDSFHNIAKFRLDAASLIDFYLGPDKSGSALHYSAKIRSHYFGDTGYELKLANYLKEFRIEEQYGQFKDVAAEMCLKARYYDKKRRQELKLFFESAGMILDEELITRLILGNYHLDKDLLNRPLAKFMRDIGEDLSLL